MKNNNAKLGTLTFFGGNRSFLMETLCLNSLYMAIKLKLIFSIHEEKKYKYKKIKMTPHSTLPTTEQTKKEISAF